MSDNADLYLHNSRGKAIKKSRRGGNASESISRVLNPGDYYVQVKSGSKWDSTDYDLEFNFSELPPDYAGNNRRNARDLGSISSSESYNDFVGKGDRNDFYRFTLDGERDVDISLAGLSDNADLHLWKQGTRGVIGRSTNSGSSSESINESLGAGTYYLRVKSKGGAGSNYSLSLGAEYLPNYYINVTSPNGGESWEPGNTINIAWNDNISENVKIDLYKGSDLYGTIDSTTESDGTYDWTIPADLAVGSDYKIKVASTANGNIYDFGDGNFTVAEPGFITVTTPNGGESWEPGNTINIGWNDNISENVKIDLYKGGIFQGTIDSTTESDGSYDWTIPADLAVGSDYKIKVASTANGNIYDFGDGNFTVAEPGFITVTTPNGGESWEPGNTINIGWSDNISENVKIDLYKGGIFQGTIDSTTESDGSYDWTIPADLAVGSDYKIKVASTANGNIYDFGDGNFTVAEPGFITVTTPNGGESWTQGSAINIAWNDNINENVKIDLYKGGIFQGTIDSTTESDGSYDWTIPADLAVGSDYNLKVASTANGNIYDLGDGNFTVAEPGLITVTTPNGGESWEPGNIINIGWSDNISENVKIDLYKGGIFQSTINSSTESDGSDSWTIPTDLTAGTDYNIKIASTTNSSVYDLGDRYFTINQGIIEEPPVNEREEWQGWVSKWDASSGAPSPVNVNENTSFELVGKLNLGSNIREGFDGRHGINNADWGLDSVKRYSELPTDNFIVKAYTEVDLEGGKTYKFEAKGDDGYQIWLKNIDTDEWRWVTPENQWQNTIDRKEEIDTFTHTIPGDKGGRYYVGFFHYEDGGEAYFGLNWKEEQVYEEEVSGSEWKGSFYRLDGNPPSTNFHENEVNKLAVLNLGSGSSKEFRGDWGSGSPRAEYIPSDNFAVRSYTHAYFENGKQYEFNVSADDGYQIFAKQHGTNEWFDVTTKNEWSTDAYNGKTISHTWAGPTGNYDLHFQYYEITGDAYFNLDWKDVSPSNDFKVPLPAGKWRVSNGAIHNHTYHTHDDVFALDFSERKEGSPVLAAANGTVTKSVTSNYSYGNHVEIDHGNGYQTLYGHFKYSPMVQVGQYVNQGDQLGVIGNTGYSTGPHLHFEVFYNGSSHESVAELQNFTLDGRELLDYRPDVYYQSTNKSV